MLKFGCFTYSKVKGLKLTHVKMHVKNQRLQFAIKRMDSPATILQLKGSISVLHSFINLNRHLFPYYK